MVIVIGITAALVSFASVDVCDQELTDTGQVVTVCRHLEATDPPALALALVVLAALGLGGFFNEIGFLGISLKRDLKDAKEAATSAEDAAKSAAEASRSAAEAAAAATRTADDAHAISEQARKNAEHAAGTAQDATTTARVAEDLARGASLPGEARAGIATTDVEQQISELAAEYNRIRRDMSSGPARTTQMTSVVSKMISLLTDEEQIDVSRLLSSDDRGHRLAGYADLYAQPQPVRVAELARVVIEEDKPFGQYWGLRALRRQVESDPKSLDLNTKRQLQAQARQIAPPGTDRAHELSEIIRVAEAPPTRRDD
jgi:hypothetical protein